MELQPNQSSDQEVQHVDLKQMEDQASAEAQMLIKAGKDAKYMGKIPNMSQIAETVKALSDADQEALAKDYFDKTIGESISNNSEAYKVYQSLNGTAFANKFKELEHERLIAAGYPEGFKL